MNSGFNPAVVNPSGFKVQRQSHQTPFYFGGSQVPLQQMIGSGAMKVNRPPSHLAMKGGMLVESTTEDYAISNQTRSQIISFLNSTLRELDAEERDMIVPDDTVQNIEDKVNNFEALDAHIRQLLRRRPKISEAKGREIANYLQDYIQSPVEPFIAPQF